MAACLCSTVASTARDNSIDVVMFGSLDAGPSVFLTTGAKIALEGANRDGFVALVSTGGGARLERAAEPGQLPVIVRTTVLGAALGGYQICADWGVAALFAGPEGSVEALVGADGMRVLPPRIGLRLHGEIWARPSADTLATLTLILGSARWEGYARASAGYRMWGAYLGPEASAYADRTGYQRYGLGLHATDFALAGIGLRVSAGALYEPETERFGPYLGLAAWYALP